MKHNVTRAYLASGAEVYSLAKESNGFKTISVRVTLSAHAKKRLGIPADHKAYALLFVEKPTPAITDVDQIAADVLAQRTPYDR